MNTDALIAAFVILLFALWTLDTVGIASRRSITHVEYYIILMTKLMDVIVKTVCEKEKMGVRVMRKSYFILILALILSCCFIFPAFAADPVLVNGLSLDKETAVVAIGKTVALKATIDPKNATNKKLEWISSDENIATVKNGTVKGIAEGTAVITVKALDESGATASATVSVVKPVKKITAAEPKLILAPGVSWKQSVVFDPADATIKKINWSSSKDTVATVDENGVINAIAVGKCNIIGVADDGYKAKIQIAVTVVDHDIVITGPHEVSVDFDTHDHSYGSYLQIGRYVMSDTEDTYVTFKNGYVCEGSKGNTLKPLKAGSETIDIVVKHNRRKVLRKSKHTVFVTQDAVHMESDEEIGRLAAESFAGHTYQAFYSNRSWNDAKEFCERHGGHLVTITSEDEQEFLIKYMAKAEKKESYWIGLNSGKSNKFNSWITKEAISFTNWMDNNPDRQQENSCARMAATEYKDDNGWTMQEGSWDDESPYYSKIVGFICEWDKENSPNALPVIGNVSTDEKDQNESVSKDAESEDVVNKTDASDPVSSTADSTIGTFQGISWGSDYDEVKKILSEKGITIFAPEYKNGTGKAELSLSSNLNSKICGIAPKSVELYFSSENDSGDNGKLTRVVYLFAVSEKDIVEFKNKLIGELGKPDKDEIEAPSIAYQECVWNINGSTVTFTNWGRKNLKIEYLWNDENAGIG